MFQVSVLGPVEVRRDGTPVRVPGGKTTELLVRLALEAGVLVRSEQLVDELWATEALNTRPNTLQSKIARLRRAVGDPGLVESSDGGYRLGIEPRDVDALAVLAHATTAAALLDTSDIEGAADLSTSALEMFQGDVLPAVGDAEWARPYRTRLDEARITLVETQLSARLELGDIGEAISDLEGAVADYPFQEGLWALLITALYRGGRQADALATYQRVRSRLADELGLEPGPRLQALELQILSHDRSLGVAERPAPRLGNLPSMGLDLVGRGKELAAVAELLARQRLVEIVGPGGVGKTAVAIAAGRALSAAVDAAPGGVWLARLESATNADEVIDALIAALNVSGGEAAMLERLKGPPALVVLDNCEHVLDSAAVLVTRLLDTAPGLRILCTSQIPLGLDGEAVFELAPLALDDAVELFTRRAVRRGSDASVPNETRDSVHELCRSLDGLPLAIELAAARTRTLSIEEITRRLDDRFTILSDPTSRKPERRRALRATIGWSYELLFPDDKRGLWALAVFAGGAPLPGVEFVLEALDVPASAAVDVVGRLVSRSLVIVDDERSPSSIRYRLLDSIRAFALDALTETGLADRALGAHATWLADAAATSTRGVRGSRQAEHLSFARAERANVDAALTWSIRHAPMLALDIVNGFGWAWVVLGDSRGAQRIAAALDAAGDAAPARDRATALLVGAWIEASTDRLELARDHIAAAMVLADSIGDIDLQARCSYYLAYVVSHNGEFRRALELTDRSAALYDGLDRPWDQAANWLFAARAAISAGDEARSVEACDQVVHWLEGVDDPWLHVRGEAIQGELARVQHRFDDAVVHLRRAADTSRDLGYLQTEAYQTSSLGRAQCQAGDYEVGANTLTLAIDKAEHTGDVRLAALARVHLGRVLRALGQHEGARAALESATAWHRAAGGGEQAGLGECLLAALDAEDKVPEAEERLNAVLEEARRNNDAHVEVFALDALARIAAEAGDTASARDLCDLADRRMRAVTHFISDRDRVDALAVKRTVTPG